MLNIHGEINAYTSCVGVIKDYPRIRVLVMKWVTRNLLLWDWRSFVVALLCGNNEKMLICKEWWHYIEYVSGATYKTGKVTYLRYTDSEDPTSLLLFLELEKVSPINKDKISEPSQTVNKVSFVNGIFICHPNRYVVWGFLNFYRNLKS